MDAKVVEEQIKDKLIVIGSSIASFLNISANPILHRISLLNLYVYEDYYNQKERLVNVDLDTVARAYASDVFEDLYISDKREKELTDSLSQLILSSYDLSDEVINPIIEEYVSSQPEFKNATKAAFNSVKGAIKNFLRDYEVKGVLDNINRGQIYRSEVINIANKIKADILRDNFNINIRDTYNLSWCWDTLSAFTLDEEDLKDCSEEYKNHIYDLRKKFYVFAGLKGDTLEELETVAKRRVIYLDKNTALSIEKEYNNAFVKECRSGLRGYTNIFDIYDDLKSKGYVVDPTNIAYLFNNPNVYGVNFQIEGNNGLESYVVFNNNEMLYTTEFNDTCVHESIHYLGGINEAIGKRGLYYNDNKAYLDLEEAYVNAVSKQVKELVVSKVGNIIEPAKERDSTNVYDHTLEYMNFVLSRYKKELSKVHLSSTMNIAQANKILPLDKIAKSVSRIMNCDKKDVKKYTLEEIEKLKKLPRKK